ncbi:3-oxoacyl-[acyl-carrier-protein] synthase 3 [Planctomyces sp. SH-PL62]|nr:3-oxoacyl-ACP synthase III [Planctomyces sp. SH-PL62]AMV37009.1 3-oxoacyl-[acyl-carrier-protein] synthase 3 [Planctomyces sp. SH-PL62]
MASMKYQNVFVEAFGYEVAPVVVSSAELEERLAPVYDKLHLSVGQLEALTGIVERRWWEEGYRVSDGAVVAAERALEAADFPAKEVEAVVYGGVCREYFEPATACRVASKLGVSPGAVVHDLSNACLGMIDGMTDVANRIELGQIRAGLVVACETAREINDVMIERMIETPTMEFYKHSLATLTGGSGAAAVLMTDGSRSRSKRRRLLGGEVRSAARHHDLCRWGVEELDSSASGRLRPYTTTDSAAVLRHGVDLGVKTWRAFLKSLGWVESQVDRVISHQVGGSHRDLIMRSIRVPLEKDFSTFSYLGNMGTVSLPLTAAIAEDRQVLRPGDRTAFLGIGSGLNCLMLGLEW